MESVTELDKVAILAKVIGRYVRATEKSRDMNLSKTNRFFHGGRSETYLQWAAWIMDVPVSEARSLIASSSESSRKPRS